MKNYFTIGTFTLGILILLVTCQTDDILINGQDPEIEKAKLFLESNLKSHQKGDKYFYGSLDWKNSFIENENIYIPIKNAGLSFSFLDTNGEKTTKKAKTRLFVILHKESENQYIENLIIFIDFKNKENREKVETLNLPFILINTQKEILESSFEINNSNTFLKSYTECVLWGAYHTYYIDGIAYEELLYTFWVCEEDQADDGSGGGGGDGDEDYDSGGDSETPPAPVVDADNLLLNPKTSCIYQKLTSNNANVMEEFLIRYFGTSEIGESFLGELNVKFYIQAINPEYYAGTYPIGTGPNPYQGTQIIVNEIGLNESSATIIAYALLHEAAHAKLIAEAYDEAGSTNLLDLLTIYNGESLEEVTHEQHLEMLENYVNKLAQGVREFDESLEISRNINYENAVMYGLMRDLNLNPGVGVIDYFTLVEATEQCN